MNDLPILNRCVDRLMKYLADKQEELRRGECGPGVDYNVHKQHKLRRQIASIETRLRRAEKLQEAALARDKKN